MSSHINPGPLNSELLFLSNEHRAVHIFYNQNSETESSLMVRRSDQTFFEHLGQKQIPPEVMNLIRMAGFGGVFDCGFHKIDRALITALVERWRPETHTFHLPIGEVTVTLQDIQVLWGLNVDGDVVSGTDFMNNQTLMDLCHTYLGFTPNEGDVRGSLIKISSLLQQLNNDLPDDPTVEQLQQRARLYILILIGGTIFPDLTGSKVSCFFIYNLIDLERCGTLSWGSACLAFLYRQLCKATSPEVTDVAGPLVVLQFWAWERLPAFSPRIVRSIYNHDRAYGARWSHPHSYVHTTRHCLEAARFTLATLDVEDFNWTPYDKDITILPPCCTSGFATWRCDTYLICWEIVEPHLPSRVMRQYSLFQTIPTNVPFTPDEHKRLHKLKKGRNVNWLTKNAPYIQHWQSRNQFMIDGQITDNFRASAEYMNWYWERTVLHVVQPNVPNKPGFRNRSTSMNVMMEGIGRMHREGGNWAPGNEVSQIPQRYMDEVGASHRLLIEPLHYPTEHGPFPGPPPPVQSLRRHRRRNVVPPNEGQPAIHIGSPSFHAGSSSSSYHPVLQTPMHEGGVPPSNQGEVSQLIPDLNSITQDEMFNLLNEHTPMESQQYETGFFSPQIPQQPPRAQYFGGPSGDPFTPLPFHINSPIYTPDSLNLSLYSPQFVTQTPEVEQAGPSQQNLAGWNLVRDRAVRERRPRAPCMTSERNPQDDEDRIN